MQARKNTIVEIRSGQFRRFIQNRGIKINWNISVIGIGLNKESYAPKINVPNNRVNVMLSQVGQAYKFNPAKFRTSITEKLGLTELNLKEHKNDDTEDFTGNLFNISMPFFRRDNKQFGTNPWHERLHYFRDNIPRVTVMRVSEGFPDMGTKQFDNKFFIIDSNKWGARYPYPPEYTHYPFVIIP